MNKLNELISKCRGSFVLEVNNHKDYYLTAEVYLTEHLDNLKLLDNVEKEVYNKIIEKNNIVEIQFYPENAISFYTLLHYDLDKAIDECLSFF